MERRAEYLAERDSLRDRLVSVFQEIQEPYDTSPHVERQIYDGFFNNDQERLDAFHVVPWEQRPEIVASFSDQRLRELGFRLLHMERPDVLDDATRTTLDIALAERLAGASKDAPWLTLPKAIEQIDDMINVASPDECTFLESHKACLVSRLDSCVDRLA